MESPSKLALNIALIVGCARSGTSILGELIASHPAVRYIFEAIPIWERAGMGENDSHRLTAEHVTPALREEIRGWARRELQGAQLLAEKSPRNILRIPYIRAIFPEAKIIHIVRDGRDVACSLVPGLGGSEWSHLKPPSWQRIFASHRGVLRCAVAWKEMMEIGLRDLEHVSHLQIRYEDLVTSPAAVAATLLAYLRLDPHPAVMDFCGKISNNTASAYHAQHQHRWFRDDHRARVGRWRENLADSEQQQTISALLACTLSRLGYRDE